MGQMRLNPWKFRGGLIDNDGEPNLQGWESPSAGALREFRQESISEENKGVFPVINNDQIRPLGVLQSHPSLTDKQYPFFIEIDMSPAAFAALKKKIDETPYAGNKHDQESTKVVILPFKEAFFETLHRPASVGAFAVLGRYADKRRLLALGAH